MFRRDGTFVKAWGGETAIASEHMCADVVERDCGGGGAGEEKAEAANESN
jgi:precorrin-6x reductase